MNQALLSSGQGVVVVGVLAAAGVLGALAANMGVATMLLPILLVGGIVLFVRPVVGLFAFAAMIPIEAALMIGGRSVAALVGMAVFGAWAAQKLLRREPLLPLVSSSVIGLTLMFFAFACLSLLWAFEPVGMNRRLILLLQLILLSMLVLDLASSWERVAWVAKVLVLTGTVAALLTLEQYFLGGARRAGEGVVGGLNRTAMTLVTILPFAFYLVRAREAMSWRLLGLSYIGLSAVAVAATLSRMNFLLFPIVVAVHLALMTKTRGGRRQVLLLGAITTLVISFMPMDAVRLRVETIAPYLTQTIGSSEEAETYSPRGYLMRLGIEMFKDRPVIGSGFDNYQAQVHIYQWRLPGSPYGYISGRSPHSSHIAILVGLGLVGFLLWIGIFSLAMLCSWRTWRALGPLPSQNTFLVQALTIALALQVMYGFYSEVHRDKIVWLIVGLIVAVHRLATQRPASAVGLRPFTTSPRQGGDNWKERNSRSLRQSREPGLLPADRARTPDLTHRKASDLGLRPGRRGESDAVTS